MKLIHEKTKFLNIEEKMKPNWLTLIRFAARLKDRRAIDTNKNEFCVNRANSIKKICK